MIATVLVVEVTLRIAFLRLPYSIQTRIGGARQFGIAGPALGLSVNVENASRTCIGDDRLYSRTLPGLHEEPLMNGPGNVWRLTTVDLGFSDIGFRSDAEGPPWDAVVVGDSFGYCMAVNYSDCWVSLLSRRLNKRFANLSVVGTGSVSHLRYLEDYGWSLEPSIVIWQFYTNDFDDDYNHIVKRMQGCPRPTRSFNPQATGSSMSNDSSLSRPLKTWLSHTFITYNLMAYFVKSVARNDATKSDNIASQQTQLSSGVRFLPHIDRHDLGDEGRRQGRELTFAAIKEANRRTLEIGARFVIVGVPRNIDVYHQALPSEQLRASAATSIAMMTELKEFTALNDIEYVDLLEPLRAAANDGESVYLPYDIHWSVAGNRVVAERVANYLLEY